MIRDLTPNQVALFFWQTFPNGKSAAIQRLSSISPKFSDPATISRTWSEQWEPRQDIYGSIWVVGGPGTLVMPGTTAYRVSTTNGKWSKFENTGNRPIQVQSMKNHDGLRAEDMEPIETRQVPGDVLVVAMLAHIGE